MEFITLRGEIEVDAALIDTREYIRAMGAGTILNEIDLEDIIEHIKTSRIDDIDRIIRELQCTL